MKAKNVQSIICLVIFSLFANQAWAADWIYFEITMSGIDRYFKISEIVLLFIHFVREPANRLF